MLKQQQFYTLSLKINRNTNSHAKKPITQKTNINKKRLSLMRLMSVLFRHVLMLPYIDLKFQHAVLK